MRQIVYTSENIYKTSVKHSLLLILLVVLLSSCSVTKKLPAGESLYTGATVKVVADSAINKSEVKNIQAQLTEFVKPKPNANLFGFPYKVWFYYLFGEPKNEKGFKSFFRKRFGEPPILASKSVTAANVKQINLLLNNEGYFRSFAKGDLIEKNRKSTAVYTATLHQRYYLDSVSFSPQDTSILGKAFTNAKQNSLLQKGSPYRFDLISGERIRIDNILKKRGFYYFQPDFIIVKADSSVGNHKVNLSVEIKPTTSQVARKNYRIRDVHVLADYGEKIFADSAKKDQEIVFNGIRVNDKTQSYNPKIFSQAIAFRRGGRYSSNIQDISLSRLINLNGNFKFVKNTFELVPRSDSALLDVFYYLTPLKAKSFQADINGVTKSNNFTGTNLSLSWLNKNTFKGAELFKITATAGLEFQVGGISQTLGKINTSRYSIEGTLAIPRFTIPFFTINPQRNQALPKTNISVGYEVLKRGDLYSLTSLKSSMGYAWKQNSMVEHSFTPISINLVKGDFSFEFGEEIFRSDNPIAILKTLDNTLIMSSNYNISYTPTPKPQSKHLFRFTGGIEVAGNFANLLSKIGSSGSSNTLVGVSYAQYARLDGDLRYTYNINKSLQIANRFVVGYGLPYGNSNTLPYLKQYSVGGNNSIRAFAARSIGPGEYFSSGEVNSVVLGSQTGDIKLELNTELRAKFTKYINGAFFIDAGNVWIHHFEEDYGATSIFGSDFYKQVAIGTGVGLRLDFSYLVLRFDLATPVHKPYLPEGERWVLKNFDLKDSQWRSENLVLNIAVGYPF
ncbi:BamA/TamA family outer membrane protein [Arcicella sp. LKC2W]|uniref:translocation and assembly module lipoprotein TamL n=1 Tax=Arcicella sp. LKC2W TaxID=2984198 RepID=UPI002B1EE46E|nr:BamA/TamA family outer membrane protein [Arcicella sp. LKC2W]MEA5461598.1 BamA/TamA family outer membrane protein [Arcicella sp. LKC2W]